MHYFLLHALAAEWDAPAPAGLRGTVLAEAWSQSRGTLSLRFEPPGNEPEGEWTVQAVCDAALPLLFRNPGGGRARRNTAPVFEGALGRRVAAVRTAHRDRLFYLDLEGGATLLFRLFGPHPNVWWVDTEGCVCEAFLSGAEDAGDAAPSPRPAPEAATLPDFEARWPSGRKTLGQAVAAAVPLLDRALADEAARRAGLDPAADPARVDAPARQHLFAAVQVLVADLAHPHPVVYRQGTRVEALALVPLAAPPEAWQAEPFGSVDEAVRVWARRRLAQRRFDALYRPLEAALTAAHQKRARSADAMLDELARPSRAGRYEAWGHLLMSQASADGPGRDAATLPDLLAEGDAHGAPVTVPLDPALSAVANAERYYKRARAAREARRHAEARWEGVQAEAEAAGALLERLRLLTRYADLQAFLKDEAHALARFTRPEALGEERLPYRRFEVAGWEVRVGKHARSNAALVTRHAGPHDLWLHARGVPGAHVVVRRTGRTAEVPKAVVEAAARIAAHFSEAKTQALVPVQVTERKHVRPVKGGAPGLVRVEREEVLLVTPGLPDQVASP